MTITTASNDENGSENSKATAYREGTKKARLVELLQRADGVSISYLAEALGWQPHTTRAALTGLRKDGFELTKLPPEDGARTSRYRLEDLELTGRQ